MPGGWRAPTSTTWNWPSTAAMPRPSASTTTPASAGSTGGRSTWRSWGGRCVGRGLKRWPQGSPDRGQGDRIRSDGRIDGGERQAVPDGLADEEAVERVAMERRQLGEFDEITLVDGEAGD